MPDSAVRSAQSVEFAELLLGSGLITPEQLELARSAKERTGAHIDKVLVSIGMLDAAQLRSVESSAWGLPASELATETVDPADAPAPVRPRIGLYPWLRRPDSTCSPTVPLSRCASTASSRTRRPRSPTTDTVEAVDDRLARRPQHPAPLDRPRAWRRPCRRSTPRRSSASVRPITDGFYYDFDVETPFTPEDLKAIEKEMDRIIRSGQRFVRRVVTEEEARAELAGEPYKLELIGLKGHATGTRRFEDGESVEVGGAELTIYDNVDPKTGETVWKDLCRGPHLPNTGVIGNGCAAHARRRRLLARLGEEQAAAAHLRHGLADARTSCAPTRTRLEEAAQARPPQARRRARPVLVPRGDRLRPGGLPPQGRHHPQGDGELLARSATSKTATSSSTPRTSPRATCSRPSGHLDWYKEGMFPPMHLDEEIDEDGNVTKQGQDYYLKPMNCPMHNLIFRARGRSYRELPLRLAEFGTVYRYEKSGTLTGLTRVRGLTQDDAHIYVTDEQIEEEVGEPARLRARAAARTTGSTTSTSSSRPRTRTSTSASDEVWEEATETLREVAVASGSRARGRPGRGRVLRPEDLGAGARRDRPHLAAVDGPARLQPARAVRARVHGRRRHRGSGR